MKRLLIFLILLLPIAAIAQSELYKHYVAQEGLTVAQVYQLIAADLAEDKAATKLSTDGETWGTAAVSGTFQNTTALQTAKLKTATTARYLKFVAKSEVNGNAWTSAAEIGIEAEDEATAVSALQIQPEGTKYVYDLRGHRHDTTLGSLPHGIYIADGRKVVK